MSSFTPTKQIRRRNKIKHSVPRNLSSFHSYGTQNEAWEPLWSGTVHMECVVSCRGVHVSTNRPHLYRQQCFPPRSSSSSLLSSFIIFKSQSLAHIVPLHAACARVFHDLCTRGFRGNWSEMTKLPTRSTSDICGSWHAVVWCILSVLACVSGPHTWNNYNECAKEVISNT